MTLHNFIRKHAVKDSELPPYDDDLNLLPIESRGDDKAQEELSIQQSKSNEN